MASGRADGNINFAHYSLEQLQELKDSIDAEAFPLNAANLAAELARRQATDGDPAGRPIPQVLESVRFTSRDGWLGWLQAKGRRSPLYGSGSIEVTESGVALHGWQRTWLGVPQRSVVIVPVERIRNAAADATYFRFEWERSSRRDTLIEFEVGTPEHAAELLSRLPATQSPGFANYWPEIRDFTRRLDLMSPHAWITPILVLINVVVFASMAVAASRPGAFDLPFLWSWGANLGTKTLTGQPWRLLTALFLHANLAHLLLNMLVLWNVGRMTERLYGTGLFVFLYVAAGALGNLTSSLWDLDRTTVGASAAVFGTFGAFLAYLAHRRTQVPRGLVRAHWLSTLTFLVYNLIQGALQTNIDNAAHVGGLMSGFALGWVLARPLDVEDRQEFPFKQTLTAVMLIAVTLLAGKWLIAGAALRPTMPEQFFAARSWYTRGGMENLRRWGELEYQRETQSISTDTFASRIKEEIVPFWKMAAERLHKEQPSAPEPQRPFATLVTEFARAKRDLATELGEIGDNQESHVPLIRDFTHQALMSEARLERMDWRATMDRQAVSWSSSAAVVAARNLFTLRRWKCVESLFQNAAPPAATDSLNDTPALAHAAGCRAQQLFMSGEYHALEALLNQAGTHLNDLPDGSSTLSSYYAGLVTLFQFGGHEPPDLLLRTARWRRAVPGSVAPDLLEAEIFSAWAWSARGHGYAKEVSGMAWEQFAARSEMAVAALEDVAPRAASNPVFYQLSLNLGVDTGLDRQELQKIFDNGTQRFPAFGPLYWAMLRARMPRWGGSYDEVDTLISSASRLHEEDRRDLALYARLYWGYSFQEDDRINIFTDAKADWPSMKSGFQILRRRYPDSDLILNGFAKVACIASDREQYAQLRPLLKEHVSSGAWSRDIKLEGCDKALLKAINR